MTVNQLEVWAFIIWDANRSRLFNGTRKDHIFSLSLKGEIVDRTTSENEISMPIQRWLSKVGLGTGQKSQDGGCTSKATSFLHVLLGE